MTEGGELAMKSTRVGRQMRREIRATAADPRMHLLASLRRWASVTVHPSHAEAADVRSRAIGRDLARLARWMGQQWEPAFRADLCPECGYSDRPSYCPVCGGDTPVGVTAVRS